MSTNSAISVRRAIRMIFLLFNLGKDVKNYKDEQREWEES